MKKITIFVAALILLAGCSQKSSIEQIEEQIVGSNNTNSQDLIITDTQDMNNQKASDSASQSSKPAVNNQQPVANPTTAKINTSKGVITIALKPEFAPGTVKNFSQKSQSGFYDNLTFHRVEDWVIQGGDPLGTGTGGGTMPTELSEAEFTEGSVGVARGGDIKVSNDAQFFICTTDCTWLNGAYTYFGHVTSGMDIAKQIEKGDKIINISAE